MKLDTWKATKTAKNYGKKVFPDGHKRLICENTNDDLDLQVNHTSESTL